MLENDTNKSNVEQMISTIATTPPPTKVSISDAVNNDSSTTAASSKAVKIAYDKASAAQSTAAAALPLAGGTMTGEMKYKKATSIFQDFTETSTNIAGTPTSNQWYSLRMLSSDSKVVGMIQIGRDPNNQIVSQLVAYDVDDQASNNTKSAVIQAVAPKGGTPYATAPTPPDNSNDTKIATTAWVKKQITANPSMPVGAIYVQYGSQKAPNELFGGTWQDVSSTYAGRFFRVVGEGTAAFGENQEGGAPNISGTVWFDGATVYEATASTSCFYQASTKRGGPYGGGSARGDLGFSATRSNSSYGAAAEIRPINHSVRIWKRTA